MLKNKAFMPSHFIYMLCVPLKTTNVRKTHISYNKCVRGV